MARSRFYTISASCPDQVGIIAKVTSLIAKHQGWVLESGFHAEESTPSLPGRYFMRVEIKAEPNFNLSLFQKEFSQLAETLNMQWTFSDSAIKRKVVIFVSKQEHCLYDLLSRYSSGELNIEIPMIISNHLDLKEFVEWHKIPFTYLPVVAENREKTFLEMETLLNKVQPQAIVLARYMQVLPPQLCKRFANRIINIHHSFLPSFVGAKPYHQAYAKGVKLIGATCHFVTEDLDQGPIIEQDVIRVDHTDSPEDMVCYGKDIEKTVLSRGLRYYLEDRVQVHGNKTIVFK